MGQSDVYIEVNITDANGAFMDSSHGALSFGQTLTVDSKLPNPMAVTPHGNYPSDKRDLVRAEGEQRSRFDKRLGAPLPVRPVQENGAVNFVLGKQSWDSTKPQCSTGGWDNGSANDFFGSLIFGDNFLPNRQMDCKFDC